MCQFKSALVVKDGKSKGGFRLLLSPWTESHSELCAIFKVKDGSRLTFARIEFSPQDLSAAHKPEAYKLKIDEERTPEWFDGEMKEAVADRMRDYIKSIVVSGDIELLIGGQFIVAPDANVKSAHTMIANVILGRIGSVSGSANIDYVCGLANIDYVCGLAEIGSIYDSAKIGSVSGSAKIGSVCDSAKIGSVSGSAKIGSVCGSAEIGSVSGSAKIAYVSGSAKIGSVYDSAKIGSVSGSAKIMKDSRSTK